MKITKLIKRIKESCIILNNEKKENGFFVVLLRIPEYLITGIFMVKVFGNKEKTRNFHDNLNSVHKLRYKHIERVNNQTLKKFDDKFLKDNKYYFRDIIFPKIKTSAVYHVYRDVFKVYVEYGDDYNHKFIDKLEKNLPEGTYCYTNQEKGVDITIHKNDVVIDAGAWAGDFSIYAAKKGAKVYAFEPALSTIALLKKTIEYNNEKDSITIIPLGLGDNDGEENLSDKEESGGNFISRFGSSQIKITTIDNFVKLNNIKKIDFIKADIEGYERNMLMGAKETLLKLQPTLSICTYHLPDDPEVLQRIILEANPNYKIIQRKMKLFAYIDKKKLFQN